MGNGLVTPPSLPRWDTLSSEKELANLPADFKRRRQMTIITALRENNDAILIACDSGANETAGGIRITIPQKLYRHEAGSLAWATAGDTSIGDEFTNWLREFGWPPPSWQAFKNAAIGELSRLNGLQRKMMRRAGLKPKETDGTAALVAGWIEGKSEILEFGSDGKVTSYLEDGFKAIGSGESHALIAYITMKPFRISALERLRHLTQTAAMLAQKCDLPVHIWRVAAIGIEEIA